MSAMLYILAIAALIVLCWYLGGLEMERNALYPHAYQCHECHTGFSDARVFVWHREAVHPHTYDFGSAPNAARRRSDADRDSAGENPGDALPDCGASPAVLHETKARRHLSSRRAQ